jgi:putative oxidoreductase
MQAVHTKPGEKDMQAAAVNPLVTLIARLAISSLFIVAGLRKAMAFAGTVGYFTKLGFPMPELMVGLAIAIEVGGGILLIIGFKTRWVALALMVLTLVATFMAHRFWEVDPAQYGNQLNHFLKNIAIAGSLILVATIGAGAISADRR